MSATVKLLLSLSLSGSIIAVIIFVLKPFIKHKFSKSIQYYVWIVVLLRLVLPFSFDTSIMNKLFYGNGMPVVTTSQGEATKASIIGQNIVNSHLVTKNQEKLVNTKTGNASYFQKSFNQYALYLWMMGVITMLTINLIGYTRFLKYLKQGNKSATNEENRMLATLLNGRYNVRLTRNRFSSTPMLIGIIRPCIVIPDIDFNETQIKNVLLHEIVHLKRFDIGVKWLTMVVTSLHWFNPLMYFIKKDINSSCELACDEAVIKNLSTAEKQDYGDTLISVVAENKFPNRILRVTMIDEKKGLKERLVAIMNHSKKSRSIMILSAILLGLIIIGALYLGAGIGTQKDISPNIYINAYNLDEISKYKTPYVGDNSKVSAIVNHIPVPDNYFKQRYISVLTDKKPYKLNVFYEGKEGSLHNSEWPIVGEGNATYSNMSKNALVLFCMVDNLDEVTFAFRESSSDGKLDQEKYDTTYIFKRASFKDQYGNLFELGVKRDLLLDLLKK